MAARWLPVDENHATDLAAPKGEPSPARGWIVEMQQRLDGIWGRVEWTNAGRSMLAERVYRFISPAFAQDTKGTVLRIVRAALTNIPNLPQLVSLNTRGRGGSIDVLLRRAEGGAFLTLAAAQGKPVIGARGVWMTCYMHDPDGTRFAIEKMPSLQTHRSGHAETPGMSASNNDELTNYLFNSPPSPSQIEIARRMGIDPKALAAHARKRAAESRRLAGYDANKIGDFEGAIVDSNKVAELAARSPDAPSAARPTSAERDIAKRMGLDPGKLAQARESREAKDRDEVLSRWDGHLNPGGAPDRSYQLTALDSDACRKLGVDPQQFLAWKRDPTSAPRPQGLPRDPNDQFRRG
jgi:transposase-like protein